jgi:hypothetical protein
LVSDSPSNGTLRISESSNASNHTLLPRGFPAKGTTYFFAGKIFGNREGFQVGLVKKRRDENSEALICERAKNDEYTV